MITVLDTKGLFYNRLCQAQNYSKDARACIERTVQQLLTHQTTSNRPGMLLGKIQSGKTRTFLGVMGLAFDNGYAITIILTKGTVALATQTLSRVGKDFGSFRAEDELQVFESMHLPDELLEYELQQKLIIVCKKEDDNLIRLEHFLDKHPSLRARKTLIIDDEADFASIGFRKTKAQGLKINVIAGQISDLRTRLQDTSFLQVTATPYSLYLQPRDVKLEDEHFRPVRPAFTELVPIHSAYVGGEFYFDKADDENSSAYYLRHTVSPKELQALKQSDRRRVKLDDLLANKGITALRAAVVNFIVGGCIRRIQARRAAKTPEKFSFIVHTERGKGAHAWQELIVKKLVEQLAEAERSNDALFEELVEVAYRDLEKSIEVENLYLPAKVEVTEEAHNLMHSVMVTVVNSEKDINVLLDSDGQLRLRTPLNIFIGGQILDRGLTIGNLIGFYYGRSPQKFQQDTVLQHSRMYGARPLEDLAVTRFYTSGDIYAVMKCIHELDTALREAFENGGHDQGVVFLQKDTKSRVIPCSPNKILLTSTTTLKPSKRLLPIGFQTDAKVRASTWLKWLNDKILEVAGQGEPKEPFLIPVEVACDIADSIRKMLVFEEGYEWDVEAFKASLQYVANRKQVTSLHRDKVFCLVRRGRDLVRIRTSGRFQNAPDTRHVEGELAIRYATDIPMLMLFQQNGKLDLGWNGLTFWWPVAYMPTEMETVIFASDTDNTEA